MSEMQRRLKRFFCVVLSLVLIFGAIYADGIVYVSANEDTHHDADDQHTSLQDSFGETEDIGQVESTELDSYEESEGQEESEGVSNIDTDSESLADVTSEEESSDTDEMNIPEGIEDEELADIVPIMDSEALDLQGQIDDAEDNVLTIIEVNEDLVIDGTLTVKTGKKIVLTNADNRSVSLSSGLESGGSMISIQPGASLTIRETGTGSIIIDGDGKSNTGIRCSGEFTLSGGKIRNHGSSLGNAIMVGSTGKFIFEDGIIENNHRYGVVIEGGGTMEMSGGTISNNDAYGIYYVGGNQRVNLTIKGGEIRDNGTTGVYIEPEVELTLGGGVISNNGAYGIYCETYGTLDLKDGFIGNNNRSGIYMDGGGKIKVTGTEIENNNGSGIYLNKSSELVLENGSVSGNGAYGVYCASDSVLVLNQGSIGSNQDSGIHMNAGGTLEMNGGQIHSNESSGVYLNSATFVLNAGVIGGQGKGNISENGGGVRIKRGTFVMNGGEISYNQATAVSSDKNTENNVAPGGGGILVGDSSGTGSFRMYGGSIHNNVSALRGGGISIYRGEGEFYAGTIENNSAEAGGGIYTELVGNSKDSSYFGKATLFNAVITENEAKAESNTSFQFESGAGGGIWHCPTGHSVMYVNLSPIVYANDAEVSGDDVHTENKSMAAVFVGLVNEVLGSGAVGWYEDSKNNRYGANNPVEVSNIAELVSEIGLKAVIDDSDIKRAEELGTTWVRNNTAVYGGGIANNGELYFGADSDQIIGVELEIQKLWDDQDALVTRPDSIKLHLYQDEMKTDKNVLLESNQDWFGRFTDLDYTDSEGEIIDYSVKEDVPYGYKDTYKTSFKKYENGIIYYQIDLTNTYTVTDVTIQKLDVRQDNDGKDIPLADAEFTLCYQQDQNSYYYSFNQEGKIVWIEDAKKAHKFKTGIDGKFQVNGLEYEGTYYLREIEAPDGYILPDELVIEIEINAEGELIVGDIKDTRLIESKADGSIIVRNQRVPVIGSIIFQKVDATEKSKALKGAEFQLYQCSHLHDEFCGGETNCEHTHESLTGELSKDTEGCWKQIGNTITTDEYGIIHFEELGKGEYILTEVKAPEGYQLPKGQWHIVLEESGRDLIISSITAVGGKDSVLAIKEVDKNDYGASHLVFNQKNYTMPRTGGIGYLPFYLLGGFFVVIAGASYVLRKSKKTLFKRYKGIM